MVLVFGGLANADWVPEDGHKMHWPQLPDENGWDIMASERVVLYKTARIEGEIVTPKLTVEEGAVIEGRINMVTGGEAGKGNHLTAVEGNGEDSDAASDRIN